MALDTNILLDAVRLKIRVVEDIRVLVGNCTIVVPIQVKQELQTLSTEKGKNGLAARIALETLSQNGIKTVSASGEGGDQALVDLAQKGYIVATNDRGLRQSLKNTPQRVIVIRQSKYVAWL